MTSFPILSVIILLPLFGSLICSLVKDNEKGVTKNVRDLALWISIIELFFTLLLVYQFNFKVDDFQFYEKKLILSKFNISYFLGVDAISVIFILLTAILFPICILYSKNSIKFRTKEFMVLFLLLEALIMGVFSCLDIVLFYIFFESLLIPMFLIIGIWGGNRRIFASYKFFLYTLAGSVFFLISIIVMANIANTTSIIELDNYYFEKSLQKWLWIGMFVSFAIKVPMWPFHTWLPDAHVEAPTVGSIILAGILLKVGGYAFIRISLPILPYASYYFSDLVIILSIIAIIYTSFVAFAQNDMKKMIAYSSVAHMGYVTAGIFSLTEEGIKGGIFQMVSHGIVSSALFLSIGVLYEQTKSRSIESYSFIVKSMPLFSLFFIVIVLSSIGLPGTSGFIGELLSIVGVFKYNGIYGFFAGIGLILGAVYMLNLVRSIIFKKTTLANNVRLLDVNISESLLLFIFVFFTMVLGILPNFLLQFIDFATLKLLSNF